MAFESLVSEEGVNLTHTGNTMSTVNWGHCGQILTAKYTMITIERLPCSALLSGLWIQTHQTIVDGWMTLNVLHDSNILSRVSEVGSPTNQPGLRASTRQN